jgi:16S rRNA (guanine1207-N2)-methyltransferase
MIVETVCGHELRLWTEPGLFSRTSIDAGTLAMLSCVAFQPDDKVLDLGCGYGVVGIVAARTAAPANVFLADFAVPKHFIEKGFNRVAIGGSLFMVTKRELWYRKKLEAIFGGVRVRQVGDYFVFEAIKKTSQYANATGKRAKRSDR